MVFREALKDGTMEGFFQLIAHFQTQAEPAFCGLASLSVVLNAMAIDPGRTWKGPWRWFDESMLECCESLEKVKVEGMTFAKVACAGACAGASVKAVRANNSSLDEFRQHVLDSCSTENNHVIVSYDRKILEQTGAGHFSPIGGYHRGKDLALILDVARFKYPPHWVSLALLWDAVKTIDSSTGKWRGFILARKPKRPPSVLFTLSCKDALWSPIARYLMEDVPKLLKAADIESTNDALSVVLGSLPGRATSFLKWIAEVRRADAAPADADSQSKRALNSKVKILEELRGTELYSIVSKWTKGVGCLCPPSSLGEDELSTSLKGACCHGAAALSGMLISSSLCCVKTLGTARVVGGTKTMVVVGDISTSEGMQGNVDVLIPTSPVWDEEKQCIPLAPASSDVLTMLLFALPATTWYSVRNKDVQFELCDATSVKDLPSNMLLEVKNLQEQLYLVHRWCSGTFEEDCEQLSSFE